MDTTLDDIDLHGVDDKGWDLRRRLFIESLVHDVRAGLRLRSIGKLELGKLMFDLKQEVGHGDFEIIRDANFAIPKRSANRYAAAARDFWDYREQVAHLYQNDLQKLAEKEALRELKGKLLSELADGKVPDAKSLHEEINRLSTNTMPTSHENTVRTKAPRKVSAATQAGRKISTFPSPILQILDGLLPRVPKEQRMLVELLSDEIGKVEMIRYMKERLKDLLKHAEPDTATDSNCSTEPKTLDQSL